MHIKKKLPSRTNFESERGFSFIEMIVALAISSIVILVFFQSVQGWMRLSSRTYNATESAIRHTLKISQFQQSISGLTASWKERPEEVFHGDPSGFMGLTRTGLSNSVPILTQFEYRLEHIGGDQALQYKTKKTQWVMEKFPGDSSAFSYLGADLVWRPSWPPAETPEPGPFNDAAFLATPQLPLAIRLTTPKAVWVATIASTPGLPFREQDLRDSGE